MATIVLLAGGLLGFLVGCVALLLGLEPATALALWVSAGLAAAALAGLFALVPQRRKGRVPT
ncbi:MAG: hypothetical protein IAE87_14380 [Rhodobacteraceae bacterium]|jgi:hypothetical protein|nr:hypothetical protein [Paracoccaceae bacterium]